MILGTLSKNLLRRLLIPMVLCSSSSLLLAGTLEIPQMFRRGVDEVRDGRNQQALETASELEKAYPQLPFGPIVALESYWDMIYCDTGHINSNEIWNLAFKKTSVYDKPYFESTDRALKLSHAMRQNSETAGLGALYEGLVRGARSRLYAVREQSMASASDAKQMRSDLLDAVAKDPKLTDDAELGLGNYNYYVDVLSPMMKLIRVFFGFPGGNRDTGLEQIKRSSEKSEMWGPQAKFELARIYGIREGRHADALALLRDLATRFPNNALYALSATFQAEAMGQREAAIEYARKAAAAAKGMDAVCRERLGGAATGALDRLRATMK